MNTKEHRGITPGRGTPVNSVRAKGAPLLAPPRAAT